ncbi:MAG: polyprenol monophosphomannose synthase [Bacteroidia bacterium]|nr:polyprenol monophosphomannose synthase [Bacteroidia bacterium]MCX7651931.1 polyprenol monophosphomannose synthase [Bacteroidia bacterium]MDW8416082.1 polyprenol monophosphomannose synthase [Bacteroidia bacterium]
MPPEHWVVLPTYNEADNIYGMLNALRQLPLTLGVLVVDDNSPDGTADIALTFKAEHPDFHMHILRRSQKEGLGRAYEAGFQWVLEHTSAQYIYEMDADFSHPPNYLPRLADALESVDIAIGSRYIQGINVVNWPLSRILLSYGASWYVRFVTGMPVRDPTAGFVGYRRSLLERILSGGPIRFRGYAFQIEMKYKAFLAGARWQEVPIVFVERVAGHSKMSRHVIQEAIWGVIWLRWHRKSLRLALRQKSIPTQTGDAASAFSGKE